MLFKLMRTVSAGLVLVCLVKEGRAAYVFAFGFHVLMTFLVHHRPASRTLVALQANAIDEVVTLRTVVARKGGN